MIDIKDKQLIYDLELNARLPVDKLAKKLSITEDEVKRRLEVLQKNKVISGFNSIINIAKLGYTGYGVFVKFNSISSIKKKKLINDLQKNPFVYWICSISGKYDLLFGVQTKDIIEFDRIFKDIIEKHGYFFRSYSISIRSQVNHFKRQYLVSDKERNAEVYFGKEVPRDVVFNEEDLLLLHFIGENARCSFEDIALKMGKSVSVVKKRLKSLEDRGIILGYHSLVHPEKWKYKIYQFLISINNFNKKDLNRLFNYCMKHPNITIFVQSIGEWNFEITCEVENLNNVLKIRDEIYSKFNFVKDMELIPTDNYYLKYHLGSPSLSKPGELIIENVDEEYLYLFRDYIRQQKLSSDAFEFCNGYIDQAIRNSRNVAYQDNSVVFFTKKSKAKNSPFVIVGGAGLRLSATYVNLAKHLSEKSKKPVFLKNVSSELKIELKKKGFREYKENEHWDNYAKYDDNTFDQILIKNNSLLNMKGSDYKKLREELNVFDRKFDLEIHSYDEKDKEQAKSLIDIWSKNMAARHNLPVSELVFSHLMYIELKNYYYQYLIYEKRTRKYVGFICLSAINDKVCGFNALVNDFSYENLYRKMMYLGIEISSRLGFAYTNIQGSETSTQFISKKKFIPDSFIERKHLVYDYKS